MPIYENLNGFEKKSKQLEARVLGIFLPRDVDIESMRLIGYVTHKKRFVLTRRTPPRRLQLANPNATPSRMFL
jgi:hypothetical protein